MNTEKNQSQLEHPQKILLLFSALILATFIFFLKGGLNQENSLDYLARRSLEPQIAFLSGKPTVLEFYADWCEVCREMAPKMVELEKEYQNEINIVMLNVDNPEWEDFIDKYDVNGIPQFNFFDNKGSLKGKSIGNKTKDEMKDLLDLLIQDNESTKLKVFLTNGKSFSMLLEKDTSKKLQDRILPMSHS